jgi:hypothetical protein
MIRRRSTGLEKFPCLRFCVQERALDGLWQGSPYANVVGSASVRGFVITVRNASFYLFPTGLLALHP